MIFSLSEIVDVHDYAASLWNGKLLRWRYGQDKLKILVGETVEQFELELALPDTAELELRLGCVQQATEDRIKTFAFLPFIGMVLASFLIQQLLKYLWDKYAKDRVTWDGKLESERSVPLGVPWCCSQWSGGVPPLDIR